MWCPDCRSSSPLVALQPEGLICARCGSEILNNRPTADQSTNEKLESTSSKLLQPISLAPEQLVYRFDKSHPAIGSRTTVAKQVRKSNDVQIPSIEAATARNSSVTVTRQRKLRFLSQLNVLAVALFISGQSAVLWAFSQSDSTIFAAGILVSAIALAVTLYVVSRCVDEQPSSDHDQRFETAIVVADRVVPRPKRKTSAANRSGRRVSRVS